MRNRALLLTMIAMLFVPYTYADTKDTALRHLAKQQGLFFFYSSTCPHCQRFAPTLKRISQQYGFKIVAISIDGGFLPLFPDAVMDEGQSNLFQIKVFPSVFLINPRKQLAQLVTEGSIDEPEFINRLLKISQTHDEGMT